MFKKVSLFLVCASLFATSLGCSLDGFRRGPVQGAPTETPRERQIREAEQIRVVETTVGQALQIFSMGRNTGSGRRVLVPVPTQEELERNAKIVCCGTLSAIICAIGCCLFSK